jgi:hypothetical protein
MTCGTVQPLRGMDGCQWTVALQAAASAMWTPGSLWVGCLFVCCDLIMRGTGPDDDSPTPANNVADMAWNDFQMQLA